MERQKVEENNRSKIKRYWSGGELLSVFKGPINNNKTRLIKSSTPN